MLTAVQDWVFWLAGGVVGAAGVVVVAWGPFGDRYRGRRCPKCWYDMRGSVGLRCSECGWLGTQERQLFKTRRRRRAAAGGVLVALIGFSGCLAPNVRRDGWLSVVPSTILILAAPQAGHEAKYDAARRTHVPAPVAAELSRRGAAANLWPWQWRYVIEHKGVIRTRKRWPRSVPLAISMAAPQWAEFSEIRATPCMPAGKFAQAGTLHRESCGNAYSARLHGEKYQVVGPDSPRSQTSEFDIAVKVRRRSANIGGMPASWATYEDRPITPCVCTITLPVEFVNSVDDAIRPVRSDVLDRAVRASLAIDVRSFDEPPRLGVIAELRESGNAILDRIALGLRLDLILDDSVRDSVGLVVNEDSMGYMRRSVRSGSASWSVVWPRDTSAMLNRWRVRVRGDGEAALADWDRDEYWAGAFTIPLGDVLKKSERKPSSLQGVMNRLKAGE